jgi:hypothetical protein
MVNVDWYIVLKTSGKQLYNNLSKVSIAFVEAMARVVMLVSTQDTEHTKDIPLQEPSRYNLVA